MKKSILFYLSAVICQNAFAEQINEPIKNFCPIAIKIQRDESRALQEKLDSKLDGFLGYYAKIQKEIEQVRKETTAELAKQYGDSILPFLDEAKKGIADKSFSMQKDSSNKPPYLKIFQTGDMLNISESAKFALKEYLKKEKEVQKRIFGDQFKNSPVVELNTLVTMIEFSDRNHDKMILSALDGDSGLPTLKSFQFGPTSSAFNKSLSSLTNLQTECAKKEIAAKVNEEKSTEAIVKNSDSDTSDSKMDPTANK